MENKDAMTVSFQIMKLVFSSCWSSTLLKITTPLIPSLIRRGNKKCDARRFFVPLNKGDASRFLGRRGSLNTQTFTSNYFFGRATLVCVLFSSLAFAQPAITKVEKLPLEQSQEWSHPQFSPNGQRIYFTTVNGNGIWEYSLENQAVRQITNDPQSGAAFTLSPDGKQIAFRRTFTDTKTRERAQEIVLQDLVTNSTSVLASGADVSAPLFSQNDVLFAIQGEVKSLSKAKGRSTGEIIVLGIENTKVSLNKNGTKTLLDPFPNGNYIWPVLSPDKTTIVAYEMDRGAFVCDVDGKILATLGRRNAPSWTRTGKWIIYMDDKDDGHQILSSDLHYVSPDGTQLGQLTFTSDSIEMYPQCSPTENKIVYCSLKGEIFLLNYTE